jgi:hypothetical protein
MNHIKGFFSSSSTIASLLEETIDIRSVDVPFVDVDDEGSMDKIRWLDVLSVAVKSSTKIIFVDKRINRHVFSQTCTNRRLRRCCCCV